MSPEIKFDFSIIEQCGRFACYLTHLTYIILSSPYFVPLGTLMFELNLRLAELGGWSEACWCSEFDNPPSLDIDNFISVNIGDLDTEYISKFSRYSNGVLSLQYDVTSYHLLPPAHSQ